MAVSRHDYDRISDPMENGANVSRVSTAARHLHAFRIITRAGARLHTRSGRAEFSSRRSPTTRSVRGVLNARTIRSHYQFQHHHYFHDYVFNLPLPDGLRKSSS